MFIEGFIIADNETKQQILKNQKEFKNYMFLTYQELKSKLSFTVDKKAIFKVMNKYNVNYFMAKEYLDAIKLIENKTPKYSYNSGLCYSNGEPCYGEDLDSLYQEVENGSK